MRTHPFGSARAPSNWGRVTHFDQFVLRKIFGLVAFVYVDEAALVGPFRTANSAHDAFANSPPVEGILLPLKEDAG